VKHCAELDLGSCYCWAYHLSALLALRWTAKPFSLFQAYRHSTDVLVDSTYLCSVGLGVPNPSHTLLMPSAGRLWDTCKAGCVCGLLGLACWVALWLEPGTFLPPASWSMVSVCIWLAYATLRGMDRIDRRELLWGIISCAGLTQFLIEDGDFKGWGKLGTYLC
jgi:hypothetical protein